MTEVWRPCFDGYYSVSSLGRVRRERPGNRTAPGRILRATKGSRGYPCVDLYGDDTHRVVNVHRLVAAAFLGPCAGGLQVNHKSGDKTDNRRANLEYVTCQENHLHAFRTGLRANRGKLTPDQVRAIRRDLSAGATQTGLAARYAVTQSTIWAISVRKTWRKVA